jgi:hypothetical protein
MAQILKSKFYQHFTSSFCADNPQHKKLQSQTVIREKLSYKNCARKMLMKSTPDLWIFADVLDLQFQVVQLRHATSRALRVAENFHRQVSLPNQPKVDFTRIKLRPSTNKQI